MGSYQPPNTHAGGWVLCQVRETGREREIQWAIGGICFLLFYFIYAKYFEKEHKNSKLNYIWLYNENCFICHLFVFVFLFLVFVLFYLVLFWFWFPLIFYVFGFCSFSIWFCCSFSAFAFAAFMWNILQLLCIICHGILAFLCVSSSFLSAYILCLLSDNFNLLCCTNMSNENQHRWRWRRCAFPFNNIIYIAYNYCCNYNCLEYI